MSNFDSVARLYDTIAYMVFGNLLKKAQKTFLSSILDSESHILIIGGGTGWILETLLMINPEVRVTYVEASAKMLKLSQRRLKTNTQVTFVHGTEQDIPAGEYDWIITNFFLDVFGPDRLTEVMAVLKSHLAANGTWICTDFRNTDRPVHRFLLWSMHRFFRVFTRLEANELIDFRPCFLKAKMNLLTEKEYRKGLVFSALYSIKK